MKLSNFIPRLKNILHLKTGREMDAQGNQYWYWHRQLDSKDGAPAFIGANGEKRWYKFGELHRDDGKPAVEGALGGREWWVNDRARGILGRHREGGPAVENTDGTREWWVNNRLSREDGPAIERPDGKNEWFRNGEPWPQGKVVTPIIQQEQKAQAMAEVVQSATVADETIKLLQPLKFAKKPNPAPRT